jgi:hypothetical protein
MRGVCGRRCRVWGVLSAQVDREVIRAGGRAGRGRPGASVMIVKCTAEIGDVRKLAEYK